MQDYVWHEREARRTLRRLQPRIQSALGKDPDADAFMNRLQANFLQIFRLLHSVYGTRYDFFYHLEQILLAAVDVHRARPQKLRELDRQREANPDWFQSEQVVGAVIYVDLFANNLQGVRDKIPYLLELGVTYLHLMPLFDAPAANSDGGYAVSDYRKVNPSLGTMKQLAALADDLREHGISLVVDFVFNHTSDEHQWAQKALAGDEEYQDYYYMFDDRSVPDQYERTLREIFPEQAPGSFTYRHEINKWVWTTFNRFQWDLNYKNPTVFRAMMGEMLFLANQGVEFLRLDAVAFIWKEMGTSCENLPQAHWLIQAFNALTRVAAPAMLFKSEAIVHPREVATYISWEECPVSYNPTLMALTWESLATRKINLLRRSMENYFALPPRSAWVNYVRCHDDIGWTFADEDAAMLGINGYDHRQFLNRFYTGRFEGSFATGLPFNYNPVNQDMRICGMAASLAGLEQAITRDHALLREHALRRLELIHSIIISAGGIPLLYLGDEIATLNDYRFEQDPAKKDDQRWVHRPQFDWQRAAQRDDISTPPGRIFQTLKRLIALRKAHKAFAGADTRWIETGSEHVLGYVRSGQIVVLANFSEYQQVLPPYAIMPHLRSDRALDLIREQTVTLNGGVRLEPYQFMWLRPEV